MFEVDDICKGVCVDNDDVGGWLVVFDYFYQVIIVHVSGILSDKYFIKSLVAAGQFVNSISSNCLIRVMNDIPVMVTCEQPFFPSFLLSIPKISKRKKSKRKKTRQTH